MSTSQRSSTGRSKRPPQLKEAFGFLHLRIHKRTAVAVAATLIGSLTLIGAGQVAARCCPTSKAFYERKRAEGKNHRQAVIALARRRLNVLWALIRDGRVFEITAPPNPAVLG